MARTKRPPQTSKKLGGARVSPDGPREAKASAVAALKERLGGEGATILTEYRGLTVQDLADLRASLREAGAEYKVFKNTLARIAAREVGLSDLEPHLLGPTAFAFAGDDVVVAAKRLAEFAKKVPALVMKAGIFEGRVLSGDEVRRLSALESREVMLARVVGMAVSPLQQMANVLAAGFQQLGAVLVQLRDRLQADGAAPEPAPESLAAEAPEAAAAEAPEAPAAEPPEAPAAETEPSTATEATPDPPAEEASGGEPD